MKRGLTISIVGWFILCLLTACAGGGNGKDKLEKLDPEEQVTLKVMAPDENYFFQTYGSLFISQFPNVDVEVANMQPLFSQGSTQESLQQFVEDNEPDVLLLNADQYEQMAQTGKLFALDSVIVQDKYDLQGIQPSILNLLRTKGNGNLYGLSPTFQSEALFYNIDLFQKYGVEPPRDAMTWEEILALAERFPAEGDKDNRVYGISFSFYTPPVQLALSIARTEGLRFVDADATQVTLTGDGWKRAFQSAADAIRSEAILIPDPSAQAGAVFLQDYYNQDPFLSGKAAMMIDNTYEVQDILGSKRYTANKQPFNWGITTAPVSASARNESVYVTVNDIFAVNAQSPHIRAAWEFIKYITGDDYARVNAKSSPSGELLARTAYIRDSDGVSLEPFYKLAPADPASTGLENTPDSFQMQLVELLSDEMDKLIAGDESVDEALRSLQDKAQAALDQATLEKQAEESAPPKSNE
ncbi:extracellular solute-binding protein [Cohnella lubricantis]|uniref:Extracellular solute-binding protein n=1 Tax=Cohnella lubricantis TaxID=2163172 RepID=A0A841T9G0_9BACL|nr:extracellular solute-binding protein [Cohnella lubricantis]MBB6677592.1 extracellular solute-binding protein [Cohnella lubricantis]MBP2116521.1 multiple sugar transport system substrate-binding protein [Cohnella lubricantis]